MTKIKSGFLTIIGPANAGKSTLLNSLLNFHLNIISNKPQTTRNNIAGILTDKEKNIQLIITDTPGILKKNKSLLDQKLHEAILTAIRDTDLILFMIPHDDYFSNYSEIINKLKNKQVIYIINKSDLGIRTLTKEELEMNLNIISISALKKSNLNLLLDTISPLLTEEIQYYPDDVLSDRTERFFAKEYIRETILKMLRQEIPHQTFIDIDEMNDKKKMCHIKATIYIERENHKKMIIGKNGEMIKKIGIQSRKKIEELLEKKVNLKLLVKIKEKWRSDPIFLKKLEYY